VSYFSVVFQFPTGSFRREDESPDSEFYREARLVTHIDDYAIAAVGEAYRAFLEPGGEYLDLMSSWVSHFPADFEIGRLIGHGMNEEELRHNPKLAEYFVQDLNANPTLPLEAGRFDGVTICVSVQYLTRPVEVFREIGRILKPGKPLIVTYSNRCFPTKAVYIWQRLSDADHGKLVALYAEQAGAFDSPDIYDMSPRHTLAGVAPDEALREQIKSGRLYTDPLFAVVARKKQHDAGVDEPRDPDG
jgi:SAM-dependent methyltransferase